VQNASTVPTATGQADGMTSTAATADPSAADEPEALIRPFRDGDGLDADVDQADVMAFESLSAVGRQFGFSMGERDAARIAWAQARIRYLVGTDAEGSFVAEQDGRVVGIGLSLRRGDLWFLSLLAVQIGLQAQGIGRRLLDATLEYGKDCAAGMICASPDPKALRRYGRAGFALHPAFEVTGKPSLDEMPADLGVRDGDWDKDLDFVEELITARRGEPYQGDLLWYRDQGVRLHVRDGSGPDNRAFALSNGKGRVNLLAGASDDAAARVLWQVVAEAAESGGEALAGYLQSNQQWAIDVALAAKLRFAMSDALCTRGTLRSPSPYLPSGIFG
jgi:predicted N-acetyltransferase YhbS